MKLPGDIDLEIRHYVELLDAGGVETFESCQGGPGHCYDEPTICFHGDAAAGPKAVGVALENGLPVAELRRYWSLYSGEMDGPKWALTFRYGATEHARRDAEKSARYFAEKATGRAR